MKLIAGAIAAALVLGFYSYAAAEKQTAETKCPEETLLEDFTPKRGKNTPLGDESDSELEAAMTNSIGKTASGWYCRHTTGGERPEIPPEMAYITDHSGYYLGKDEKVIYLTFDAGYENGNIEKILDTLKSENVPGAFFILENLVRQNADLVKRMADEGHTVCNHTAKHRDMTKTESIEEFSAELCAMENIYKEITGLDMAKYYRPPEGKLSEQNVAWADEIGYKTIMWSYAYADWDNEKQMNPEKAIEKVISGTHNGEVILLHPTSATNAAILPTLISKWKEMGYRFGTLDELTGDAK